MKENRAKPDVLEAVAIGLVRRGECFLVGRRGEEGPLPGYAEFPGGKCLPGESAEQCVVRECMEETGLNVVVLRRRCEIIHAYPHGNLRLTFLDCEPVGDAEPSRPFQWVPRSQLAGLNFPEANRQVVAELLTES